MSDGPESNRQPDLGMFGLLTSFVLCLIIVGVLAYGSGLEDERRSKAPASYSQAAREDAKRTCVRAEPVATFECVYGKVEASQEQARGEQDLTAQQRSASSALLTAIISFLTLVLSGFGLWFIYGTLKATREAVVKAGEGTDAANAAVAQAQQANETTERIGTAQVRAYISIKCLETKPEIDGAIPYTIRISNSGQSPARRLHLHFFIATMNEMSTFNLGHVALGDVASQETVPHDSTISFDEVSEVFVKGRGNGRLIIVAEYVDVFDKTQRDPFHFLLHRGQGPLRWDIEPMSGNLAPGVR